MTAVFCANLHMRGGDRKYADLTTKGLKVQRRLDEVAMSRDALAQKLGITDQTLANWMKGNTQSPRGFDSWDDAWTRVATEIGLAPATLLDDRKPLRTAGEKQAAGLVVYPEGGFLGTFRIPVPDLEVELPKWPAVPANESWDIDPQEWEETEFVPNIFGRRHNNDPLRIVAPVVGRSMEPRLYEGDLVVIELDRSPRTGRIVLAKNGQGQITLKVLNRDRNNRYRLDSINPEHGQAVADTWEIVGFLIGVIRDYRSGRGLIEWDFGGLGP
jgi:hypothetical protein